MKQPPMSSRALATEAPPPPVGMFGETQDASAVDARRIWRTLMRRRRLLVAVFAGFFVAVVVLTLIQPRTYTVTTKLIAGNATSDAAPNSGPGSQFAILNLLAGNSQQTAETYAELISEEQVAQTVINLLHLNTSPGVLIKHVLVKPVTNTSILNVAVSWKDPETAAAIANSLARAFVDQERQLVSRGPTSAVATLEGQLPDASRKLKSAQSALAAYEQQTGIVDLPTQTTSRITKAAALDAKLQEEEQVAAAAGASLEATNQQLAATLPTVVGSSQTAQNPVVSQLTSKLASDRLTLSDLQRRYTNDNPLVISAKSSVADDERELGSQPRNVTSGQATVPNPDYEKLSQDASQTAASQQAAQAAIAQISAQIAQDQPSLDELPEVSRRNVELNRAAKTAQDFYDGILAKLQEAHLAQKTALSDIEITQPADPSSFSTSPNLALNALLGAVVGAVLALAAVFIVEFFDDRLRTVDDVKERLALPVLATIPMLGGGDGPSDGTPPKKRTDDWIRPLSVESFYQLVASLRYTSSTPPRTIAFTSAQQGDGKSTIAVNTAISMALMKARVLVVDADLRRPSVHTKLAVANDRGLSDVLVGLSEFADVVRPTSHDGVWVVTSGRKVPNPVALLQGDSFDRFLQRARERFDFVIVDGPALSSIVDGLVIGIKTDGTVLVVNANSTEGRSAQAALAKLRSMPSLPIIGVVLNGTRPDPQDYSDYYLGSGQSMALPGSAAG